MKQALGKKNKGDPTGIIPETKEKTAINCLLTCLTSIMVIKPEKTEKKCFRGHRNPRQTQRI
jgi:hypothetical protein